MDDWQNNLVLIAKNTLVWLHQLSVKYQKNISQLDEIPEEEIEYLKSFGINGLWLIGIWERSPASKKIKELYGKINPVSSAYSIYQYEIAENLGGKRALEALKKLLVKQGIYLACDMVPNHTGLDSPWLILHPDWFISTDKKPADEWTFNSPNLLADGDNEVRLEDGYFNQTGAAEVFKYSKPKINLELFIYHGNDGTSMPWNDTAQLNYLNAEVRQAVKEQILNIAKKFNIIRLDAAMTLVKQHFHRLWFPQDRETKCIPTRENFNLAKTEIDQLMPVEFWREVMQEITKSSPDTLLMAEAFWLMEKYFIEELGIHRVYNSAFMQHLSSENNKEFRSYLSNILDQDALLLEKFINYLTTPDEKTAIEQFGKTEKYFGACGLISVLPGLPLLGHGQIEGLTEKYSMDIDQPFLDESIDEDFIKQHKDLIAPLLNQRNRFSSAKNFILYDFFINHDLIDENVIVFSNRFEDKISLVFFNNQKKEVAGHILKIRNSHKKKINSEMYFLDILDFPRSDSGNNGYILLKNLQNETIFKYEADQIHKTGLKFKLPPYGFFVFDVSRN